MSWDRIISCVGGPLHGHRIRCRGESFEHVEEPDLSARRGTRFWYLKKPRQETIQLTRHVYRLMPLHQAPNTHFEVYAHESVPDEELVQRYFGAMA